MRSDDTDDNTLDRKIDEEIERALTIEPSPEFTARVRLRVAIEEIYSRPNVAWSLVPIGFAAAVAMLIIASNSVPPGEYPEPGVVVNSGPDATARASANDGDENRPLSASSEGALTPVRPASRHPVGDVVLSRDEAAGLRVLVAAVQSGRLDGAMFEDIEAKESSLEFATLTIMPIVIDPLLLLPLEGMNP